MNKTQAFIRPLPIPKGRETSFVGNVPVPARAFAPGSGVSLWSCADSAGKGFEGEEIEVQTDTRFIEIANKLLNIARTVTTRPADSFRKLATVNPTSSAALALIGEVLGPALTSGLLRRAGCSDRLARAVAADACGEPLWPGRLTQAAAAQEWGGPAYVLPPLIDGIHTAHSFALGAAEGRQLRLMAGMDDISIAYPSLFLGELRGISASFEELPEGVAGTMRCQGLFGWKAEIVLSPKTIDPARALTVLLAAWVIAKSGDPRVGEVFTLLEEDLVAEVTGAQPAKAGGDEAPSLLAKAQAAADFMIFPLERAVLELRIHKGRPCEEAAGMICLCNLIPNRVVVRVCETVLSLVNQGVPL